MATIEQVIYVCDSCGKESCDDATVEPRTIAFDGELCAKDYDAVMKILARTGSPRRQRRGKK